MEQLLHYCWKHKLFPLQSMKTTDGQLVEVIDTGLHNRHAGPDFFNAKLKINGTLWVGNVEIHIKASDWYLHGHHQDHAYDNVILHVASIIDAVVTTAAGRSLPQLPLDIPPEVKAHYEELLSIDEYPPCYKIIPQLSQLTVHSWTSVLQTERLEQKTTAITERVRRCNDDWETAYFITLARNFGFSVNGDVFEQWAFSIPLRATDHHRDDLFQIEALFLGQAGLLDLRMIPERYQQDALTEGYFTKLYNEYSYLQHKFSLQPIDASLWKFLRLRPQNFPHIRIVQLANLYFHHKAGLRQLIECDTIDDIRRLLETNVTPYWETHFTFGSTTCKTEKNLSHKTQDLLIINTVVPVLFAYGRAHGKERLCDRAFDILEIIKPENNYIVRMWEMCGLTVTCAGDSQALIQLKREYCDKKDCLRCRFGYEYLKVDK
ncbi:MAG: DUF2851 family protein [Prevotella sp.]|nr:DUF2851 family protein [Prevotella sp.]